MRALWENMSPSYLWEPLFSRRSSSPKFSLTWPLLNLTREASTSHPPLATKVIPCASRQHTTGSLPGCAQGPWASQCSRRCIAERACPHYPCSLGYTQGPPWPFPVRGKTKTAPTRAVSLSSPFGFPENTSPWLL